MKRLCYNPSNEFYEPQTWRLNEVQIENFKEPESGDSVKVYADERHINCMRLELDRQNLECVEVNSGVTSIGEVFKVFRLSTPST